MEAHAALRTIVRRDSGETYRQMLRRMAKESGIATPTAKDLIRLDRALEGRKPANEDWTSPIGPDARITEMKDGGPTTRCASMRRRERSVCTTKASSGRAPRQPRTTISLPCP